MVKSILAIVALAFLTDFPPPPVKSIKAAKSIAVVSAVDPILVGQKEGVTIFSHDSWIEENSGFDLNAAILGAIKASLNREVKLVAGKDVGVVIGRSVGRIDSDVFDEKLKSKLVGLGRDWGVDYLVVVYSTQIDNFTPGKTWPVAGIGHFFSHFDCAYCILQATIVDCRKGTLSSSDIVKRERALAGVDWHFNWNEYTPGEQRAFLRVLTMLLNESVPELLASVGLNDTWKPAPPPSFRWINDPRKPLVPEGNEIVIPDGVSRESAHDAVVAGFKEREWTITEGDGRIVGVHRSKKKEARCTVTFADRKIILVPEGYKIQADGNLAPVAVYQGWHDNLKESIVGALFQAPASDGH